MTQWLGEKGLAARVTGSPISLVFIHLDRVPSIASSNGV